ncbi:SDR family oxidoreductase [Burkholderia gladioli]|uniref:SDR family oxidoreductase n=1 Tax=Burkholderia gladioli TaxID=28095 RepID=UPI00163E1FE8|nr:SDR family oxidoreductase [Burkholderia gladioli]
MSWRFSDIPDQRGRFALVTGATGGIGLETALALAGAGARVLLAGRDDAKGAEALHRIRAAHPRAEVEYRRVDLASLDQVRRFAEPFESGDAAIDLLIDNAGVMTPPTRHTTADGFELQFGTNYLSHFALSARLLPALRRAAAPRVVVVGSLAHRLRAAIHFDDLQWTRRYDPWQAYAQSKLAMQLFAFELQRRSEARGWGLTVTSAHPGFARTGLQSAGPNLGGVRRAVIARALMAGVRPLISHSAAGGALPTLFAATSPDARPGAYYGPRHVFELRGPVGPARIGAAALDREVAARLWAESERLTGVSWPPA